MAVRNCFIRGSVVRYVQLPKAAVDTQLLEDATRRGEFPCLSVFQAVGAAGNTMLPRRFGLVGRTDARRLSPQRAQISLSGS